MKYVVCFECKDDCYHLIALSDEVLNTRCRYEKNENTWNSLNVFDTQKEAISSLGTSRKNIVLPDGRVEKIMTINYPDDPESFGLHRLTVYDLLNIEEIIA